MDASRSRLPVDKSTGRFRFQVAVPPAPVGATADSCGRTERREPG